MLYYGLLSITQESIRGSLMPCKAVVYLSSLKLKLKLQASRLSCGICFLFRTQWRGGPIRHSFIIVLRFWPKVKVQNWFGQSRLLMSVPFLFLSYHYHLYTFSTLHSIGIFTLGVCPFERTLPALSSEPLLILYVL